MSGGGRGPEWAQSGDSGRGSGETSLPVRVTREGLVRVPGRTRTVGGTQLTSSKYLGCER